MIVSGLPGSGKTTVSRLVANRFSRAARVDGDLLHHGLVVQGAVDPGSEPADEADRQLQLRIRNVASLADNFIEAGFVTVVDHLVTDRERWHLVLDNLRTRPVLLVTLSPPLGVCRQRNLSRDPDHRVDFDFGFLEEPMRAELGDVGWWLDNEHLTADETAAQIVGRAPKHAVTW